MDAPVIGKHSWRQADTAAMARNFVEEEFDLRYPRIDWRGTTSGRVESEFPIYSFLLAGTYRLVGVREGAGRALSALFSLGTVLLVYTLVRSLGESRESRSLALWAGFFMAVLPLPVFFGRAIMPESLMLAAATASVFLFLLWSRSGGGIASRARSGTACLIGSALCLALASLIKPPMLYLGLPLLGMAFRRYGRKAWIRPELWGMAAFLGICLVLWYGHAHRLYEETGLTFGVWEYGTDKWGNWDIVLSAGYWKVIGQRLAQFYLAFFGLPFVAAGLVSRRLGPYERVMTLWLVGTLAFLVVVARGNLVHDYYLLPASVPFSYFMAKGVSLALRAARRRWMRMAVFAGIAGITAVSVSLYASMLRKESREAPWLGLASAARARIPEGDLVLTAESGNPTLLYLAHRKGWIEDPGALAGPAVDGYRMRGAGWLLGRPAEFRKSGAEENLERILADRASLVEANELWFLVRLR